jgi:uncharacterized membrane protein
MRRFKPVHGLVIVLLVLGVAWGAEMALEARLNASGFQRVNPVQGQVRIDMADFKPQEVRFFRFLNSGNQEVRFFVGRDKTGAVQVAFDGDETCAKYKRGFHQEQKEWMVCNKCGKAFHLADVSSGGEGCSPVPVRHQLAGSQLILAESDILQGWRLFR